MAAAPGAGGQVSQDPRLWPAQLSTWPGAYLAREVPQARLLGIEYAAPMNGHDMQPSLLTHAPLSIPKVAAHVLQGLTLAGVGDRPVVFVAHSLGGLLLKEVLLLAASEGGKYTGLLSNTRGLLLYSVPHFGSPIAEFGWRY